jgi:hypothetical protein
MEGSLLAEQSVSARWLLCVVLTADGVIQTHNLGGVRVWSRWHF